MVLLQLIRSRQNERGAPELHPDFDSFVTEAGRLGKHVMIRHNLTVAYDGNPQTGESKELYDCDFNQMLKIEAQGKSGKAPSIFDFDFDQLMSRRIRFDDHCLGCTAGAGSSCGGATARTKS